MRRVCLVGFNEGRMTELASLIGVAYLGEHPWEELKLYAKCELDTR